MAERYQLCSKKGENQIKGKGRESDGSTYIPPHSKPHRRIHVSSAELRNGTGKRQPGGHLAERHHHSIDSNPRQGVPKEQRQGPRLCKRPPDSEEEAGTDSSAEGDELDMS